MPDDLAPKCYNPTRQATLVKSAATETQRAPQEAQRVSEVLCVFGRIERLRDHCLAGAGNADDFRQAVLDCLTMGGYR